MPTPYVGFPDDVLKVSLPYQVTDHHRRDERASLGDSILEFPGVAGE